MFTVYHERECPVVMEWETFDSLEQAAARYELLRDTSIIERRLIERPANPISYIEYWNNLTLETVEEFRAYELDR